MQINTLWTGREYYSLENCLLDTTPTGSIITSTIIGKYGDKIYQVDYIIKTNQRWETVSLQLTYQHSDRKEHFLLEGDVLGNWRMNGKEEDQFKGCIDVDIAVTPFTNTLPINRLQLQEEESREIQVIYVDVLDQQVRPVRQQYTRIADKIYHYENIPNYFEANIIVDEHGLVVDYPALFVRTATLETNYL